jgi:hypothetical protein
MTGPNPFFGLSAWPGPRGGATIAEVDPRRLALSLYLDPLTVVFNSPSFPGGDRVMARIMRELSTSAGRLADELDLAASETEQARHAIREQADPSWFVGDDQPDGR